VPFVRKIKIKKENLTFQAECKLVQKGGWIIIERVDGYVSLGKPEDWQERVTKSSSPSGLPWDDFGELSDKRKDELNRRCQRVVDCFEKPHEHAGIIKKQIHNFGQSLNSLEQEYVTNWAFNYVL
jgi:hypothetical protein